MRPLRHLRGRPGWLAALLALAVLAALGWLGRAPILGAVAALVIEETPLAPVDFAVVLADNSALRAARAAELVRLGYTARVVVFRPVDDPERALLQRLGVAAPAPHELARLVLVRLGVPADAIVVESSSA